MINANEQHSAHLDRTSLDSKFYLAPPIGFLTLPQVQSHILCFANSEDGLLHILAFRPRSRTYGFFSSSAMLSRAVIQDAVYAYSPHVTETCQSGEYA